MITFKDYLYEYAMGEKILSKAYSTNAKVGFEFEFAINKPKNKNKKYSMTNIALDFAYRIGISHKDIDVSEDYHSIKRTGYNWIVEPDLTIKPNKSDLGLEIISPPLPIREAVDVFKKVIKALKNMGAYTNESTGLHINVSLPGTPKIDFLKLLLLIGESYELKKYSRELNMNAKSHIKSIIENSKKYMAMMDSDMDIKDIKDIIHSFSMRMINEKYASFNFQKYEKEGYIEFRIVGGDYLSKDVNDLIKTIEKFVIVLSLAASKEEAQKDYYKKVYKLLQDVIHKDLENYTETNLKFNEFDNYPTLFQISKKIPYAIEKLASILNKINLNKNADIEFYGLLFLLFKFMKNTNTQPNIKQIKDIKKLMKDAKISLNFISQAKKGNEIIEFFNL
jgi:hypothetical protein